MKSLKKLMPFAFALTFLFSCKGDDNPGPNLSPDEAAAVKITGTYKGTLEITSQPYADAVIIISKEAGNTVRISAKTGEAYSNVTSKVVAVKAISGTDDANSITAQASVSFVNASKNIVISTKTVASGDIVYDFRGVKQ